MPRIRRVMCPGIPLHVTQRGIRRAQVFFTDADRLRYLDLLAEYVSRHSVLVLAYCLMENHVHLIVVPESAYSLPRVLRPVHMRYAQRINRRNGWSGHLWQGRFYSSMLDERHFWAAMRYVERNPVRARLVERAEDFRWSSAAARCGGQAHRVLTTDSTWNARLKTISDWSAWLSSGDDADDLAVIRRNTGKGVPCGSAAFIEQLEDMAGRTLGIRPQGRPRRKE